MHVLDGKSGLNKKSKKFIKIENIIINYDILN